MKIIILATTSWNLYNSRLLLAKALLKAGHEVILMAPRDEFTQLLVDEGMNWADIPLKPRGKNVFQEFRSIIFLTRFYREEKPDLVNHFTPKGVIYGSIAAKLVGVPRIFNTITGLGYVFSGNSSKFLRKLVTLLYRIALKDTEKIFQNPDDQRYFLDSRFISPERSHLILGSGVDTEKFSPSPEPQNGPPVVILPSRFVAEKGIRTLVEAARIIRKREVPVRIVLVGKPEDDQPTSIQHNEISQWVNEGMIEWWGWHNQMEKIYPLSHIVCLPTYYMEGIPKSLIEAAASRRPLIATDVPGCREIVHHGENGYLVPVRNPKALAEAIIKLATDPEMRKRMGEKSREIAVSGYSTEKVIEKYFQYYGIS